MHHGVSVRVRRCLLCARRRRLCSWLSHDNGHSTIQHQFEMPPGWQYICNAVVTEACKIGFGVSNNRSHRTIMPLIVIQSSATEAAADGRESDDE